MVSPTPQAGNGQHMRAQNCSLLGKTNSGGKAIWRALPVKDEAVWPLARVMR